MSMNNDDTRRSDDDTAQRAAMNVVRILTACEGCGQRWMVIWAGDRSSVLIESLAGDEWYEVNAAVCPECEARLAEGHMAAITANGAVIRAHDYCFELMLNTVSVN